MMRAASMAGVARKRKYDSLFQNTDAKKSLAEKKTNFADDTL